jgi:protein MpaA
MNKYHHKVEITTERGSIFFRIASVFFLSLVFCVSAFPQNQEKPSAQNNQTNVLRSLELGKSVKGIPITAKIFGNGEKKILIIGGTHGNEQEGAFLARSLAITYERNPVPEGLTLAFLAELNPDGLKSKTRVNARGVDINRNFPARSWQKKYTQKRYYPGTAPASEPETKAAMDLIEQFKPDLIISIHAPLACMNWDGPAEEYAAALAKLSNFPLCASVGYPTPGSLGEYAGRDKQIPVVTIELRYADANPETFVFSGAVREMLKQISDKEKEKKAEAANTKS